MRTLREITGKDGDVWSLEEEGGELFLMHVFDRDGGYRTCIPIDPIVLELMALAAVGNRTPIEDRAQNIIEFRKIARMQ